MPVDEAGLAGRLGETLRKLRLPPEAPEHIGPEPARRSVRLARAAMPPGGPVWISMMSTRLGSEMLTLADWVEHSGVMSESTQVDCDDGAPAKQRCECFNARLVNG
nr:uncharacterized protein CTRU02_03152 [Colletotrichum truncatum]KAF6797121.1 hypothetical protein CTRU02_03152 [Colletotrichum truncatum]